MSRQRRREKLRLFAGLAAAILVIAGFALVLYMIETKSSLREMLGDTGSWGHHKTAGHVVTVDDTDYAYTDEIQTYLLIGTDASGDLEKNRGKYGDLADFLVLLVINNTKETYGFLQIDRDTITFVNVLDEEGKLQGSTQEQICTAHWYGPTEEIRNANTAAAVSDLLGGLNIDGYYVLDMKDVGAVNDAVGGVTVTIEEDLTSIDPAMKEGASVKLSGKQAEAYVRARMSVGDGTNVSRMRRQRSYMQSFYTQVMSDLKEDPNYLNDLYDTLSGIVISDAPRGDMSGIANTLSQYENKGILLLEGENGESDTFGDGERHTEFYPYTESILGTLEDMIGIEPVTDELLENVEILEWKDAEEGSGADNE